ncbi:MAG: Nif3-like dinuclear metal center hexameric protein [Gemmatimonadetes bacterium]|nr:MAG: Nif3-like dinuclear metal center hexameric protein [Gemmatimonadota bacterium]
MKLESILQYLDDYLRIAEVPDYPGAHNGLQVDGAPGHEVERVAVAVDASERVIQGAVADGADLLIAHHGLFWDGSPTVVGPRYRKLRALLEGGVALYSAHLPLDAHPEVGNCAVLARALGLEPEGRFGDYKGAELGWWATVDENREALRDRVAEVVGGPVRLIAGGPERAFRVAVVTGGAGSMIRDAAAAGIDTLITGEGAHHTYYEAMERGVNALYAGHYATEVWGVRALAQHLQERFGLPWTFVDDPSGL